MPYNQSTENRIRVYNANSIPNLDRNSYAHAVDLTSVMGRNFGQSADNQNVGMGLAGIGNSPNTWYGQPQFNANELSWFRLGPDGTFYQGMDSLGHTNELGLQGFMLVRRELPYDCQIIPAKTGDTQPIGALGFNPMHWIPTTGLTLPNGQSAWKTVGSSTSPLATRIAHLTQAPNQRVIATSVESAPADLSFMVPIDFMGIAEGHLVPPYLRYTWANGKYAILLMHNHYPVIERWTNDPAWNNGIPSLAPWRTLSATAKIRMDGPKQHSHMVLIVRQVGGMLVVDLDFGDFCYREWIADIIAPTLSADTPWGSPSNQDIRIRDISWDQGVYSVELYGALATVGYAAIVYRDVLVPGQPATGLSGTFEQFIATTYAPPGGSASGGGSAAGWIRKNTNVDIQSTWTTANKGGLLHTRVTLNADDPEYVGAAPGIHTPVVYRYVTSTTNLLAPGGPPYLELQQFLKGSGSIQSGEEDAVMAEADFTLDRDRMQDTPGYSTWQTYLQDRHLVTWEQQWTDSAQTPGGFVELFRGYISGIDETSGSEPFEFDATVHMQDMMMWLSEGYAVVDERYLPLDWLVMQTGEPLYGTAGFRYMIKLVFGQDEADKVNGGPDNDLRWFSAGHAALIDGINDQYGIVPSLTTLQLQPATRSGFKYPPPRGDSVLSWANTIREQDRAVIIYGIPPGQTTRCFMYGRLDLIEAERAAQPLIELFDTNYTTASINGLLGEMSTHTLPGTSYNVIEIIWGGGVKASQMGILPPAFVVSARLPDTDPYNSPALTGERKLVMQLEWVTDRRMAQEIADYTVSLFANTRHETIQLNALRGVQGTDFGRLCAPRLNGTYSDTTINLNAYGSGSTVQPDSELLIMHYRHDFAFDGDSPDRAFTTNLSCRFKTRVAGV